MSELCWTKKVLIPFAGLGHYIVLLVSLLKCMEHSLSQNIDLFYKWRLFHGNEDHTLEINYNLLVGERPQNRAK